MKKILALVFALALVLGLATAAHAMEAVYFADVLLDGDYFTRIDSLIPFDEDVAYVIYGDEYDIDAVNQISEYNYVIHLSSRSTYWDDLGYSVTTSAYTYDGKAHAPVITTLNDWSFSFDATEGTRKATNAGDYVAHVCFHKDADDEHEYTEEYRDISWTIAKADWTDFDISVSNEAIVYDGAKHDVRDLIQLKNGWRMSSWTTTTRVDAGEYEFTFYPVKDADANHNETRLNPVTVEWSIAKADWTDFDYSISNEAIIYDGTEHDVRNLITLNNGWKYSLQGRAKATDAGEYEFEFAAYKDGDDNHNTTYTESITVVWCINKADWNDYSIVETGYKATYDGSIVYVYDFFNLENGWVAIGMTNTNQINAGEYESTFVPVKEGDTNHNTTVLDTQTIEWSIDKAYWDKPTVTIADFTYTGKVLGASEHVSLPDGWTLLGTAGEDIATDAGTYYATVYVTKDGDDNHKATTMKIPNNEWTIGKASHEMIPVTIEGAELDYDGEGHIVTPKVTIGDGYGFDVNVTYDFITVQDVGTYIGNVYLAVAEDPNYFDYSQTETFEVIVKSTAVTVLVHHEYDGAQIFEDTEFSFAIAEPTYIDAMNYAVKSNDYFAASADTTTITKNGMYEMTVFYKKFVHDCVVVYATDADDSVSVSYYKWNRTTKKMDNYMFENYNELLETVKPAYIYTWTEEDDPTVHYAYVYNVEYNKILDAEATVTVEKNFQIHDYTNYQSAFEVFIGREFKLYINDFGSLIIK